MTTLMVQHPPLRVEVPPFVVTSAQDDEMHFSIRRQAKADARRFRAHVGYHGACETIDGLALSAIELACKACGCTMLEPNDERLYFLLYVDTFMAAIGEQR